MSVTGASAEAVQQASSQAEAEDRSLEEKTEHTTAKLVAMLVLILIAVLCAWLWSLRRWWKHRERSNKVLDEIEMCAQPAPTWAHHRVR